MQEWGDDMYQKIKESFHTKPHTNQLSTGLRLGRKVFCQDEKKAFEMFVKIEQETNGYHWAQNFLGTCYKNGQGVTEDYTKAVEWFTKSSEQENSLAMCDLGFIVIIWDKDVFKIKPKRWMV